MNDLLPSPEAASSQSPPIDCDVTVIGGGLAGKSASLQLKDAAGNTRLAMRVDADGNPVIQFLDANGKVTNEFTATKK